MLTPVAVMVDPSTTSRDPNPTPWTSSHVPQPAASVTSGAQITTAPKPAVDPSFSIEEPSNQAGTSGGLAELMMQPFNQGATRAMNEQNPTGPTAVPPSSNLDQLMTPSNVRIISPNPLGSSQPTLIIDGTSYTTNEASQYTINGKTFSPGGSTFNINDLAYFLALSATTPPEVANSLFVLSSKNKNPLLTINGQTYTPNSATQYILSSQTLLPSGPPININSIPYALPPSPTALTSRTSTMALVPQKTPNANRFGSDDQPQNHTMDSIQLAGNPSSLAIGSAMLTPGSPPLTTSGHRLSIGTGGKIIVDGRTSVLASSISMTASGNEGLVNSDSTAGVSRVGNDSTGVLYTGNAGREEQAGYLAHCIVLVALMLSALV